jgi:mono/diheme cytochrome c family protein
MRTTFPVSGLVASIVLAVALQAQAPPRGGARPVQLPDSPGRDTTQKVCGSTCHGPDVVSGSGRTRDQWTAVVNTMVARGAKATDSELAQIITYLNSNFGPGYRPAVTRTAGGPPGRPPVGVSGRGPGPLGGGAADSHVVDEAGADRGKVLYAAQCSSCHGLKGRGGNEALPANQRGPDLIRSLIVLRDRYGSQLGPYLAKGHPMRSGGNSRSLTGEQAADLAHFLHQRVYATLRNGPELTIQNILTGDPKAGLAYFNGTGKCSGCHSATGDFAGIGKRYDPPTLQQKFLFPRTVAFGRGGPPAPAGKPVRVTVTPASGPSVEGTLVSLDDFNVALRDAEGNYRSFAITPQVKVVKNDPLEYHVSLLDEISDKNIHDVVAYLESLK